MVSPKVLAVIPARGGSKSIPRKSIKLLNGVPLIAFSIAAGLDAKSVNRVIVSTDDEEIAAIGRKFGANVPFLRPAEFASDDSLDLPLFQHALKWLSDNENYKPDVIVQLRPTSPFRPKTLVDKAVSMLLGDNNADSVRAVIPSGQNPYKMWRIDEKGFMNPLLKVPKIIEPYNMPRQKLPKTYWQTGHIDVIRYKTIMTKSSLAGKHILPVVIDSRYAIDIDNESDWNRAESLINHTKLDFVKPKSFINTFDRLLKKIKMLVLDFDGVLTDNRVMVNGKGVEAVVVNRGDGWGIARLKEAGLKVVVISQEKNQVVAARCRKLRIDFIQGEKDKLSALKVLIKKSNLSFDEVGYMGNDVNDLSCMMQVAMPIAVADAVPEVKAIAKWITNKPGGYGAVREVSDTLLLHQKLH